MLHFRTMFVDSESRRKFHKLRLDERNLVMVFDMARPKNKNSSIRTGMHGRDAARKSILQVNILQVFTIEFSEIQFIVNHFLEQAH